tara:strand:- start:55 stop:390 length:336 start_codon:yes stop_codon:yes gene_type:complete
LKIKLIYFLGDVIEVVYMTIPVQFALFAAALLVRSCDEQQTEGRIRGTKLSRMRNLPHIISSTSIVRSTPEYYAGQEVGTLRKENCGLKIFIGEMVLQHRLKGGSISEIIG